ncbi:hypothetical protein EDC04DRAFT_3103005 [Pisolithus marmoratus]|nr:hypothetical protein EDC04DRAFT_3103005 [Pisolithus marmoratus]
MQWASLKTARSICSRASRHLTYLARPESLRVRGNLSPVTISTPSSFPSLWRPFFDSRICPFPRPDTKPKYSNDEDAEGDYFDHLTDLNERLQLPDDAPGSSEPPPPPAHQTAPFRFPGISTTTTPQSPIRPRQFILRPPSSQLIKTHLSPNQCALAAAQAVRIACRDNSLPDAEYIVHSLIYSNIPGAPETISLELPILGSFEFIPIRFERPISPRLAAHCLIHHHLRYGNVLKAKTTADRLLGDGVRMRNATLEMLATALTRAPPTTFDVLREGGKIMWRQMDVIGDGDLIVNPEMIKNDGARFALVLLLKARENGQRNSDRLLERFASICLLNGEILLGAILFALIVKDFELRWQRAQALKAKVAQEEASHGTLSQESRVNVAQALASVSRIPPMRVMKSIVERCNDEISTDPVEAEEDQRAEAYQALAYLARLVDTRSLPHSDISTLLRVLYSCPRGHSDVWVAQDGQLEPRNAYKYFHGVLLRLVKRPPIKAKDWLTKQGGTGDHPGPPVMPQLSRETYNTLIHYALRHRMSVERARKLLQHMEFIRSPGLKPDIATYNILLRSGTLLRRNDLVSCTLEELRMTKTNNRHGIMVLPDPQEPPQSSRNLAKRSVASPGAVGLEPNPIPLSEVFRITPPHPLTADGVTLASYISHLTSTGRPHVVVDILWYILPEMSIVDHPAWDRITPELRASIAERSRQERLNRAVSLGPWFLTTVLNALCKAGRTGLAERVWLLAKQAEMASWLEDGENGNRRIVEGWRMPVHAYTIMLQVYGKEAKKGIGWRPGDPRELNWNPSSTAKIQKGWARYVAYRTRVTDVHLSRRLRALRLGAIHYRSMWRGALDIYNSLAKIDPKCDPSVRHLQPDERFFNAALDMFGRQTAMTRRSQRSNPAHWRNLNRRAMVRYSRFGIPPRKWNPFLRRVVHEMLNAGYTVPLGFRRWFVDTWVYASLDRQGRSLRHQQPYGFPKLHAHPFRPHALPTLKTRGLPVSRDAWTKALSRDAKMWRRRLRERHLHTRARIKRRKKSNTPQ